MFQYEFYEKYELKKNIFSFTFMIQLEPKSKKFTCPSCGAPKKFKRYVGDDGRYIADNCGICDRLNSCGYHYPPKQFYTDHPQTEKLINKSVPAKRKNRDYLKKEIPLVPIATQTDNKPNYIPFELFKQTLGGYEKNSFVKFLLNIFPDCAEEIEEVLRRYFVGTYQDYTSFPYIDGLNRIAKAKLIQYDAATGRRLKSDYSTSSLVSKLRQQGKIAGDFNYAQIFFGEHLLKQFPNKTIAVVEAEKSAIIGSLCFPEYVWLGSHSKTWLKAERLLRLGNRRIILYPDADGFGVWQTVAQEARKLGADVRVSNLIETHATTEQKAKGYDLADYLIEQQQGINEENKRIDFLNEKIEAVKNNLELNNKFNSIFDEQKFILMESNLSETEAETLCSQPANVWRLIGSMGI